MALAFKLGSAVWKSKRVERRRRKDNHVFKATIYEGWRNNLAEKLQFPERVQTFSRSVQFNWIVLNLCTYEYKNQWSQWFSWNYIVFLLQRLTSCQISFCHGLNILCAHFAVLKRKFIQVIEVRPLAAHSSSERKI